MRSPTRTTMLIGRVTVFCVGLMVTLGLVLGLVGVALAGTGVGATFNLGRVNGVDKISQLVGSTNKPMLRVDNKSAGADARALDLRVEPGRPPMTVNSPTQVTNLNADL